MKKFLTIVLVAISFSSFGNSADSGYYATEFRIVNVRPLCPTNIPTGAVCMGLGSLVTVETTLRGCVDSLVYSNFEEKVDPRSIMVEIYAVGIAKAHPRSETVRCVQAKKVRKTITTGGVGPVRLINVDLERWDRF